MKKNMIIAILIIIILGFGGWIVYEKTKNVTAPSGSSSDSGQGGSQSASSKILDYSHQGLTSVGPSIYNQIGATQLILSYNNISSLPSQLGKMDKLQVLKIDHNQLQGALIAEIRNMPLVTLDVSYNNMTGIPAEIGQLNHLQILDYSFNKIDSLPNEIANLNQLKTFNLTGNPLSADKINQLKSELPDTTIIFE